MTEIDEEMLEISTRCREDKAYREFVKMVIALKDPIEFDAVALLVNELANDIPAVEVIHHAADFLMKHGRPKAARRILEDFNSGKITA